MNKALTIKDIAEIAGVAKSTVSRYLNNGKVSEETKEKIRRVIEEHNYEPNAFAQSLKAKKTKFVGIIAPGLDSIVTSKVIMAIDTTLRENGYNPLIINTSLRKDLEIESIENLARLKVDGIILVATEIKDAHRDVISQLKVPFLMIGQVCDGVTSIVNDDYHAGFKLNQELLSLDIDTTMVKIHGYIGRPESARKKGARQFFFVNGRYMRHPYFHKAVSSAYDNLIPVGEQVSYFIYFEVEPSDIDVNIHPTKTEIKFENEQAVWQILSAAVKETLGRFNAVPSIDFDTEGMPDIPAFENSPYTVAPPQTSFDPSYNPFNTTAVPPSAYSSASATNKETERESFGQDVREWGGSTGSSVRSSMNKGGMPDFGRSGNYTPSFGSHKNRVEWEPLFEGLERTPSDSDIQPEEEVRPFFPESTEWGQVSQEDAVTPSFSSEEGEKQSQENSMHHYQYKGSYILTSVKSGLMIINQQRAHIRILFDRYMAQIENRKNASRRMLFPDMVHFSPSEIPVLEEFMDDLNALGFDLSSLGGGTYSINGIPAGIEGLNPEKLVTDMVQTAIEKGCKVKEEVQSMLALSLAKAAAIVPGQVLTDEEMNRLVDDLFAVSTPNYTPDGKTVLAVLKEDDLEKMFK